MHYEIVGNHSAVQICRWTKSDLLDNGHCYKAKFYNINSYLCCQMTPTAGFCNQKCVYCWRPHEYNQGIKMSGKIDNPKEIVDGCILAQRRKLSGFKGNEKVNITKWKKAQEPAHFAISLTGEPSLYPKLPSLIKEIHTRGKTTFLVTNGTQPEMLLKLKKERALPTQLYISLSAPNEKIYRKINKPIIKDGWKKLNKSLELMSTLKSKKVARITVVKGYNDNHWKEYTKLIEKMQADFVEVKAYMWVGFSRYRLKEENMPLHEEIKSYSKELNKHLNYNYKDEHVPSRVVLLSNK